MIPAGYLAKFIKKKPEWIKNEKVEFIYSVSGCISYDFADYIDFWKHNKYWLFDSINIIEQLCSDKKINLDGAEFFYYEIYEKEFKNESESWENFNGEDSFGYNVTIPENKTLLGYDIVNFTAGTAPECSALSCNNVAQEVKVNKYCLIDSFDKIKAIVENMDIELGEPGPYRILSVYKVWNFHNQQK